MIEFLKSLRFWRYRALYLALIAEHAAAGYDVQQSYRRAERAVAELRRLHTVLAPYGEKILTGQTEESHNHSPIRLPELEWEMAKAFLERTARVSFRADTDAFLTSGISHFMWCGRPVRPIIDAHE